jgi:hypothetical protein
MSNNQYKIMNRNNVCMPENIKESFHMCIMSPEENKNQ